MPRLAPLPLLALCALVAACAAAPAAPPAPAAPTPAEPALRVLFIGNSLTYSNDLPAMAARIAEGAGLPRLEHAALAAPDFGLPEHWDEGAAARTIAEGGWDVVVLQQGPSALPESRAILRDYTRRFAELIRAAGAQPALLAVWPSRGRFGDFPRAGESYALAAADVGGLLIPAGAGWLAAWRRDPCLKLYSPDDLHPTEAGTYLAALLTVAVLYQRPPAALPAAPWLPPDEAAVYGDAASEALAPAGPAPRPALPPRCAG